MSETTVSSLRAATPGGGRQPRNGGRATTRTAPLRRRSDGNGCARGETFEGWRRCGEARGAGPCVPLLQTRDGSLVRGPGISRQGRVRHAASATPVGSGPRALSGAAGRPSPPGASAPRPQGWQGRSARRGGADAGRNTANPMVGCRLRHACGARAEETVEVGRNGKDGTCAELAAPGRRWRRCLHPPHREWTLG